MKTINQHLVLNAFVATIVISCLLLINNFGQKFKLPPIHLSKEETALKFNGQLIKVLNFGQIRLFSSLLWVQTLMDSDVEHYKQQDLNSWMYLRFNLITNIEPKFLVAYVFGGQYLSIVKDDDLGALEIYKKGLHHFPNNYDLHANIAFHYYFEVNNAKLASEHYKIASTFPEAPESFKHLAAKMASEAGNQQMAESIIADLYEKTSDDSPLKQRYFRMLYSLKSKRDLDCLNSGGKDCARYDFEGNLYFQQAGKFQSKHNFHQDLNVHW